MGMLYEYDKPEQRALFDNEGMWGDLVDIDFSKIYDYVAAEDEEYDRN